MLCQQKQKAMNRKDTNRLNMVDSTVSYCDLNAADTAGIPAFATTVTAIKAKLVLVNSLNQIGTGTSKGVTTDTNLLRKTMTDLALKCANATKGFANSTNNNTLKALVNFSKSKLDSYSKEDVDDVCEGIHDATNANIAGATNYGATATDVTDLQAAITVYRTATQNPRQAIISKSQAIKQAIQMVREVVSDLLVGQLDVMANTLLLSNADFVNGYHQAREVIDLGSSSAKVRGTVKDINDVPLKFVVFTIYETGTATKVAEVKTDIKGKYAATKLPAGNFDFAWTLSGYKTVKETDVHISAGKDLRRKIVMDAAITREGDLAMGIFANIDLTGVGDTITQVTITAKDSPMHFYATNNPASAAGVVFLEVPAGMSITKTITEFATAVGFSGVNTFLNVQNSGVVAGHWGITFE